jgi:hypothetical protein
MLRLQTRHLTLLTLAVLPVICGPMGSHRAEAAPKKAVVRVQITYLTVTGPGRFAPPDFNPHFDDPRQALRAFQYQAQRQHMTVSAVAGPVVTAQNGVTGKAATGSAIGSDLGRTADGKEIDDHIASFQGHSLSATPHVGADGTIQVAFTLTDSAYRADDRTNRHVHDDTSHIVQKTLNFHTGDTLLLSTPISGTAGNAYAFATVTLASVSKG